MCRLSKKLLTVLLALLLGMSPLQGAIAGFASSFDQEGSVHQTADRHDIATDHAAAQDCEQCNTEAGCNGNSCSSDQCASCALVVFTVFSYHTNLTAMPGLSRAYDGFVSQHSSSLFRPPKA